MRWPRRKRYESKVTPVLEAYERGEIDKETAFAALCRLGDLRSGAYDSQGRCHHLAPYPGCSGGCR